VDLRTGLDNLEKRKLLTLPDSNLDPSVVQPVASRYTDYAIPASFALWYKKKSEAMNPYPPVWGPRHPRRMESGLTPR
jgi:hypothetical protein